MGGAFHTQGLDVQEGFVNPDRTAYSTRNSRPATWLQLPLSLKVYKLTMMHFSLHACAFEPESLQIDNEAIFSLYAFVFEPERLQINNGAQFFTPFEKIFCQIIPG